MDARARACGNTRWPSRPRCAATRAQFGENEDDWGIVALLHDFDYERYPTLGRSSVQGCEILRAQGYPEWVMRAILSHADYTGVTRETPLEKTLFACDEMAGFVTAAVARAAEQERPRPRGAVGHQADEGQGLRARGQARGLCTGRRGARPAARGALAQRHRFMREQADALGLRGRC